MTDIFKLVGRILIENADALEAISETTQEAKNLKTALDGAGTSADNTSDKLGSGSSLDTAAVWLGNALYKLTEKAVELGFTIGKLGFNYNADMETYKVAFTTMMDGNAEAADALIESLRELGEVTPMNTAGLVKNAKTMMGFGIAAEDVVDTLKMLGDAAQGDQTSLDSLVLAYSQMMAAGQLYAQDAMQMTNAGFPIWKALEEYTGEEIATLRKMGEDGAITTEMVTNAFKMATSEGGNFYKAMENQSETFNGKMSTIQDVAEMTAGNVMQSFFDIAKSDVLPKLTESLETFGTWATENQHVLKTMAEGVGAFATISFDALLTAFKWITTNGELVAMAIMSIATAMALAAKSAHPYAYAVTAIVSALAMMKAANADGDAYNHFFNKYTDEDLAKLQEWVDQANKVRELQAELEKPENMFNWELGAELEEATAARNALKEELDQIDGLESAYNAWRNGQAENAGEDIYLDVPLRVADGAESDLQTEMDGMDIMAYVKLQVEDSAVTAYNPPTYTQYLAQQFRTTGTRAPLYGALVNGSHADGLDYVPYDNYVGLLHKGEAILTNAQATAWRSGGMGNTSKLEALLAQMMGIMQQVAANTSGGTQVVLDSGAVVGQLAPAIDSRLGTISSRKGRGN